MFISWELERVFWTGPFKIAVSRRYIFSLAHLGSDLPEEICCSFLYSIDLKTNNMELRFARNPLLDWFIFLPGLWLAILDFKLNMLDCVLSFVILNSQLLLKKLLFQLWPWKWDPKGVCVCVCNFSFLPLVYLLQWTWKCPPAPPNPPPCIAAGFPLPPSPSQFLPTWPT